MNIKSLLASCLIAAGLFATTATAEPSTPNGIPDGWLDAMTSWHRGTQLQLTYFSVTPLPDNKCLLAFVIQGHGDWKCVEVHPDFSVSYMGSGSATQGAVMQFLIVDANCVDYGFQFFNVHGYSGPQL